MSRGPFVTNEERIIIEDYIRGGMEIKDIASIVKRHPITVSRIKKKMDIENVSPIKDEAPIEEPTEKEEKPSIVESDYAKAKMSGDPRWCTTSLNIEKTISIVSSKTGFKYRFALCEKDLTIDIDGDEFRIPISKLEAFTDELIDVVIEIDNFKKRK